MEIAFIRNYFKKFGNERGQSWEKYELLRWMLEEQSFLKWGFWIMGIRIVWRRFYFKFIDLGILKDRD